MTETIGNPLSWSVDHARAAGKHLGAAATHIGHGDAGEVEMPRIRHLAVRDLKEVLQKGVEDFAACRTDVIFVCLLYPIIGVLLAWVALHNNLLPLLFPITSGFALLGPIAAVGLYEMSRQREMGAEPDWSHALAFTKSPSFAAIFALGLILGAIFIVVGIVAFVHPGGTFEALAAVMAFFLIFKGFFDIIVSIATREEIHIWWVQLIAGIVEVLIGFWAAGYWGRSAILLVIWVGATALARGISSIFLGVSLHGIGKEMRRRMA